MTTDTDRMTRAATEWAAQIDAVSRRLVGPSGQVETTLDGAAPPYLIRITVTPEEQRGRLIGKGHAIFNALRILTAAWSGRHQIRTRLELVGLTDRPTQLEAPWRSQRPIDEGHLLIRYQLQDLAAMEAT